MGLKLMWTKQSMYLNFIIKRDYVDTISLLLKRNSTDINEPIDINDSCYII